MNTARTVAMSLLIAAGALLFADDFDDWGSDFGDGSSSGAGGISLPVTLTGEGSLEGRAYGDNPRGRDRNEPKEFPARAKAGAKLGAAYSGTNMDMSLVLKFDKDVLDKHHEDIIDELVMRGYFGNLTVEGGKMKIVWGKGDKLHVIDNFNSDDYTDFIIPDYLDRRLSVPMLRVAYAAPTASNLRLEAVAAMFKEDRFAKEGIWTPASYSAIEDAVKGVWKSKVAAATPNSAQISALMEASQFDPDDLYPDTNKLKHVQGGLRVTGTAGSLDWGASYYCGRFKQPTANLERHLQSKMKNAASTPALGSTELPELNYDMKQTFGLELATVLWRFNLRGEAAYNLTKDTRGDDPWVHNNSVQWLAGFDIDIPINNLNVNVQEYGTFVLKGDKIGSAFEEYGPLKSELEKHDADYDAKGCANNKLVVYLTDSYMNGKICPEVKFVWGIERGDIMVMPKLAYKPGGNLEFNISGLCIWCRNEDSEFYEWRHNSFASLGMKCRF